jgi:thiol-disulfide isomerase/thioredoxin
VITSEELDWSDRNPYVQLSSLANRLFRKLNAQGNGRLTKDDLLHFFEQAALGKDHLSADDFREALLAGLSGSFQPGDAPKPAVLIRSFFAGELGSMHEGPRLNEPAPDFTLKTVNGKDTVQLAKLIGAKPVVLVFGNFTCGPFRARFGSLEELKKRYGDRVEFLAIYVREAHPTDGWRMSSNDDVGIAIKQPRLQSERVSVAKQCCTSLTISMPVLVDEMDDRVGHAYSGMPNRLYLIDREGRVAYKSGRGPFGFKPGELEQSLVMLLLDQESAATKTSERLP